MNVGIIGCGNMGGAIARGILRNPALRETFPLRVCARSEHTRQAMREAWLDAMGVDKNLADGAAFIVPAPVVAREAEILVLAVKPYQVAGVIRDITPGLTPEKILVSVAAGVSVASLREYCGAICPVVRAMPNTLISVGQGIFGLCCDDPALPDEGREAVSRLFAGLGQVALLPEDKMNAFSALAGCGPAYVFYMTEALIEAGVSLGLSRAASSDIAFSLLRGCAALAEESGQPPAILREQVSSPGGMTIAGLNHLDRSAARGIIIDAILAAAGRGKEMEQSK